MPFTSVHSEKYIIQMLGRWKSTAFMRYIRVQLAEFSTNLSSKMIQSSNTFQNITPDVYPTNLIGPTDDTEDSTSSTFKAFYFKY